MNTESTTRTDIATFAAYCVGGFYGDAAPETEAEYRRVLADDAVHFEWRKRYREYQRQMHEYGQATVTGLPTRTEGAA